MRLVSLASTAALLLAANVAFAQTQPAAKPAAKPAAPAAAATASAGKYTTAGTQISTLMADPEAKAVLVKYMAEMVSNPQFEQAGAMTLKDIAGFAPDQLTDAKLAEMDADLAKIPPKK